MAYGSKPDSKLVETPVDHLCGDPNKRGPSLASDDAVYGMQGPEGLSANGEVEQVLVYKDIVPGGKDAPSDTKTFKGAGEV